MGQKALDLPDLFPSTMTSGRGARDRALCPRMTNCTSQRQDHLTRMNLVQHCASKRDTPYQIRGRGRFLPNSERYGRAVVQQGKVYIQPRPFLIAKEYTADLVHLHPFTQLGLVIQLSLGQLSLPGHLELVGQTC